VSDSDDQCADTPAGEHPDGERAGCPVPDTDGDGVLDPEDQCVDVAAGVRADPTRAGCPLPDDDGDGIVNRDDACPNQPAGPRADRWRSGCPDNDPDHDGVLGENDRCPEQPETINSVTDNDGCPDQGASLVTWAESGESLRFARAFVMAPRVQSLSPLQLPLATQAALRVRARGGEVTRVVIEVMPGLGAPAAAEAARLAGVVRDIFIAQRISARMVVALAAQRPAPVRPGVRVLPPVVGTVFIRIERRPEPSAPPAPAAN
jgi:hypothetical protein